MKALSIVGARPNFVKTAPVISELGRRHPEWDHVLVHTGQHYDPMMSEIFLDELGVGEPDHMLGVGSASHAVQTARVLERLEPVLEQERPDLVVVPGDVNSTLAATLTAGELGLPPPPPASGLRRFPRPQPAGIKRLVAAQVAAHPPPPTDRAGEDPPA